MFNSTESLCRICLGEGATIPIFEDSESEDDSNFTLQSKLSFCLNDKLEDEAGYPRHICDCCQETLNTVFNFINKYKETCRILEEGILVVVKQENNENYEEYDEFVYPVDVEFTFETFEPNQKKNKIEFEDGAHLIEKLKPICKLKTSTNKKLKTEVHISKNSERKADLIEKLKPLCKLKTTGNKKICKKETPLKKTIINKPNGCNTVNKTNRIASSLLERKFVWNGENWLATTGQSKGFFHKKDQVENNDRDLQHQHKGEKRPPEPVLCGCCGETFLNLAKLRTHEEGIRKRGVKVTCSVCNVQVSSSSLPRHIKTLHSDEKKFICNVCGKGFALSSQLNMHIKGVHEKTILRKPTRRLPCKFCDKDFITKKLLICHERMHTGERPEVCTVCDKKFTHEDYLREHMRLHTGECPFECPVCGRGYPHLGNMKSHMKNHRKSELSQETLSKIKPTWFKYLRP